MRRLSAFSGVLTVVLVFGSVCLAGPQVLEVSPTYLEFSAYEGGTDPCAQALSIWNSGHSNMSWTVTPDCNWISVVPNTGSSSGEVDNANVSVDISVLTEGTYTCHLTVTGSGAPNSPQFVDVNLVVIVPEPEISLSATYFEFMAYEGGANPSAQVLGVSNIGGGTLNWVISEDCNWLLATPNSGSSTGEVDNVNLSMDISGLAQGTYNCQLTVSDANASNNPQIVDVNLFIGYDPNLVSYWKFDEGAGTTAYDSAGSNNGLISGAVWTSGKFGGALSFDGSNDYVDCGDIAAVDGATGFTIMAWINTDSISAAKLISRKGQNSPPYFLYLMSDYTINFGIFRSTTPYESKTLQTVTPGQWYFVGGTYDGETLRTYINGLERATNATPSGPTNSNGDSVRIGSGYSAFPNAWFDGIIDDVRIYNRALSADEVWHLWSFEPFPPYIELSAAQFEFFSIEGSANPADQILTITNTGGGTLNWQITEDCNWLTAVPNSGSSTGEADDVNLNVDISGLAIGTYNCQLTISDENASNSPQIIDVTLVIYGINPVSHWKFDEAAGTTAYDSVGSHNGTIYGATWTSGQLNSALDFDGSNDRVNCNYAYPDIALSSKKTITAWAKSDKINYTIGRVFSLYRNNNGYRCFSITACGNPATWRFEYNYGLYQTGWLNSGISVIAGQWVHIALVQNGTNISCYVNGVPGNGASDGAAPGVISPRNAEIGWGATGDYFDGKIDDVRIYNRVLFSGEIEQLYHEGLTKASAPNPANRATGVNPNTVLSWSPGENAASHDIYLGTDCNDVNDADTSSSVYMGNFDVNSFDPCGLAPMNTYYWRIDEVNDPNLWKGYVWSFDTITPIIELSATKFEFFTIEGGVNPNDLILSIRNIGGDILLNWTISYDCNWLIVEPNSGSSMAEWDDVNLSVDITDLTRGSYTCELTVSDPNATNSPQNVTVILNIYNEHELKVPLEYGTIQAAIDAALDGNVIGVADGTYTGTGNYNIDLKGKRITLSSLGGADNCIIDCQNSSGRRGFYFHSGENSDSIVSGFTIKFGQPYDNGGGIYCSGSSPTIENCIIRNNRALRSGNTYGGGIYCTSNSDPLIVACTINSNGAVGSSPSEGNGGYAYGGGIYCSSNSEAVLIDCIITNNTATGGRGNDEQFIPPEPPGGGGSAYGGGCYGTGVIVNNCLFVDNRALGGDSGSWLSSGIPGLSGGSAYGGGIYCDTGTTIGNCTFITNTAAGGAGGGGTPPGATGGSGAAGIRGVAGSTVSNCIVWGNTGSEMSVGVSVSYSDVEGGYTGTGNINADPCFATGPEGNYYLSQVAAGQTSDSPCVDAGSDTATNLGLDVYTTRTDEIGDANIVDMGYHYPIIPHPADIDGDSHIDLFDFTTLGNQWLQTPAVPSADIAPPGGDGIVDIRDLGLMAEYWLWQE